MVLTIKKYSQNRSIIFAIYYMSKQVHLTECLFYAQVNCWANSFQYHSIVACISAINIPPSTTLLQLVHTWIKTASEQSNISLFISTWKSLLTIAFILLKTLPPINTGMHSFYIIHAIALRAIYCSLMNPGTPTYKNILDSIGEGIKLYKWFVFSFKGHSSGV